MGFFCVVISLLAEPEGLLSFLSEEVGPESLNIIYEPSKLFIGSPVALNKYLKEPICGFSVFQRRYLISFFLCVGGRHVIMRPF